jgi:lipoate-protein ligase B
MTTPHTPSTISPASQLHIVDAGLIGYRAAWDLQLRYHEAVAAGEHPGGVLMLLEHPPVITMGRRMGASQHLLASPAMLASRSVELVETDRGGDITFHGPGQLVAYPILPLNAYHLNLHTYLRLLEQVVIDTLSPFNIPAFRDPFPACATGVWVGSKDNPEKITAIGIKVRRWITLHGLALNVSTDLAFFNLINPCGLSRPVTSIQKILGPATPPMPEVKSAAAEAFQSLLKDRPTSPML